MPSLTNIRDAAVGEFKAACPGVTGVRSFSGELDLNTAKSLALGTGVTVLVAALEAESVPPLDRLDLAGTFAALVVVAGADGREAREAKALAIAEKVTVNIHGNTFGLSGVGKARVASLSPITDDELDKARLSVWSIVWQQSFTFDPAESL